MVKYLGVVLPEPLYDRMRQESKDSDGGRKKGLLRGARLLAVLKGLGYSGAHIGGPALKFAEIDFLLNEAERRADDWQEYLDEFTCWPQDSYFYEPGEAGELNGSAPALRRKASWSPHYAMSSAVHDQMFVKGGVLYKAASGWSQALDGGGAAQVFGGFEHLVKLMLFGCRNCGDCTLAELGFLCPQNGCAKYLLNGPCGGSRDGWCEVYPGRKKCLYVRIYERLKVAGLEEGFREGFVPPRDWSLNETSSWINFFLNRDHTNLLK